MFFTVRRRFPSLALRASVRATKNPSRLLLETARGFENFPGDTYFRVCCTIIGSESLTTVFGMGTGVSFPISSPGSTATGRLRPAAANLLLGIDGCVPFVLAYYSLVSESFVTGLGDHSEVNDRRYMLHTTPLTYSPLTLRPSANYTGER